MRNNKKIHRIIFSKTLELPLWRYRKTAIKVLQLIPEEDQSLVPWISLKKTKTKGHRENLGILSQNHLFTSFPEIFRNFIPDSQLFPRVLDVARRNYLHRVISEHILQKQRQFIKTGQMKELEPCRVSDLVHSNHPFHFDGSHFHRVLQVMTFEVRGNLYPSRVFFPSRSSVARERIQNFIAQEALTGEILSERKLQEYLYATGIKLSRRAIIQCRRQLSIPCARNRRSQDIFSRIFQQISFGSAEKKVSLPEKSAVYFLQTHPAANAPIFYIGKTKNLRKRIQEYIRKPKNPILKEILRDASLHLRYLPLPIEELSPMEYYYYKKHIDIFGHPPAANRITPARSG